MLEVNGLGSYLVAPTRASTLKSMTIFPLKQLVKVVPSISPASLSVNSLRLFNPTLRLACPHVFEDVL